MPTRRPLHHTPPPHVPSGSWFFITICCQQRNLNQLCHPPVAYKLIEDATHYHRTSRWGLTIFLLMPDHIHAILSVPVESTLAVTIRNWKRMTARFHGIRWQRDFFDHRLRSGDNIEFKVSYIRENPVRAGLVLRPADWPFVVDANTLEGR